MANPINQTQVDNHIRSSDLGLPNPPDKQHKRDYAHYIASIKEAVSNHKRFIEDNNLTDSLFCRRLIALFIENNKSPATVGEILKRLLTSKVITPDQIALAINSNWVSGDKDHQEAIHQMVTLLPSDVQCHLILNSLYAPGQHPLTRKTISLVAHSLHNANENTLRLVALKIEDKTSLVNLLKTSVGKTLGFIGGSFFYQTERGRKFFTAAQTNPTGPGSLIATDKEFIDALSVDALYNRIAGDGDTYNSLSEQNRVALFLHHVKHDTVRNPAFDTILASFTDAKWRKLIGKLHTSDEALYEAVIQNNSPIPFNRLTSKQQLAVFNYHINLENSDLGAFKRLAGIDTETYQTLVEKIFTQSQNKADINKLIEKLSADPIALRSLLLATSKYPRMSGRNLLIIDELATQAYKAAEDYKTLVQQAKTQTMASSQLDEQQKLAAKHRHSIANAFADLSVEQKMLWLTRVKSDSQLQIYTITVYLREMIEQLGKTDNTQEKKANLKDNLSSFMKNLLAKDKPAFTDVVNVFRHSIIQVEAGKRKHRDECITDTFAIVITNPKVSLQDAKAIINAIAETKKDIYNSEGKKTGSTLDVNSNAKIITDVIAKMLKIAKGKTQIHQAQSRAAAIILGLNSEMKEAVVLELLRKKPDASTQPIISAVFANHHFSAQTRAQMLIELHSSNNLTDNNNLKLILGGLNETQLAEMLKIKDLRNKPELLEKIMMHYINQDQGFDEFVNIDKFKSSLPHNQSSYYQQLAEVFDALLNQNADPANFEKALRSFIGLAEKDPAFFEGIYKKLSPSVKNNISAKIVGYDETKLLTLQPNDIIARLLSNNTDRETLINRLLSNNAGPVCGDLALRIFNDLDERTQRRVFDEHKETLKVFLMDPTVSIIKHLYHYYPKHELADLVNLMLQTGKFTACKQVLIEGLGDTNINRERYAKHINAFVEANRSNPAILKELVKDLPVIKHYLSSANLQDLQDKKIIIEPPRIYHPSH